MSADARADDGPAGQTTGDSAGRALALLSRLALPVVLALLVIGFSAAQPDTFGTWTNLRSVLNVQVTIAFLAFAATLPLIVGEFDLSIGSIAVLAQVLVVGLVVQSGWSVPAAVALAIAVSAFVGVVNGIAVARYRINSFVGTLASGSIVTGVILAYTEGESIYGRAPAALTSIARGELAGIPLPVVYMAVVAAALTLLLTRLPAGRRMYAIGANRTAAERTGISGTRHVVATFTASAVLAAVGGILMGSRLGAASPDTGFAMVIPAFAAVFLGATAFWPGRFNVLGTLTAVYVIAVTVTGLQQIGVALWVEPVFQGVMLFVAVGLSAWTMRLRARRARRARLRELEQRASEVESGHEPSGVVAAGR